MSKEQDAICREYRCVYCFEVVANGVGPSGSPTITTILNNLPSSHVFFRSACQHDVDYHQQIGKSISDWKFLQAMKKDSFDLYPVIERDHWYSWLNPRRVGESAETFADFSKRRALIVMAYRNYIFVKVKGGKAYKEGACKILEVT